jgi:hypothetical protein
MTYYPHNLDFLWITAGMEGRSAECVRAARELAREVAPEAVARFRRAGQRADVTLTSSRF